MSLEEAKFFLHRLGNQWVDEILSRLVSIDLAEPAVPVIVQLMADVKLLPREPYEELGRRSVSHPDLKNRWLALALWCQANVQQIAKYKRTVV